MNGTFDGETLTVRSAVAGALYDPGPAAPLATPCEDLPNADCDGPSEARLAQIQEELQDLPGVLTLSATRFAVQADVVFDDGSLQAWADEAYGGGVVVISSALVPLTR